MTRVMQDVGCNEHGSTPGHQPSVDVWHIAQVTRVHKDHATAGDGGWRGILQVTHLRLGMYYIELHRLCVLTELDCPPESCCTE